MSKNSKAKRDAKRKKQPKTGLRSRVQAPIEAHGEMKDGEDRTLLSIGKQGEDWLVVMNGQVVAGASNAADIMVMLHQFADDQQAQGVAILNAYSTTFKQAATQDAEAEGLTLDEYIEREKEASPELPELPNDDVTAGEA